MRQEKHPISEFFVVHSGDYHSLAELDPGDVPLISCGNTNNGFMGNYDIPADKTYQNCITVAYNGSWPLLAKFHPYPFGAKDDVAVLIPRQPMSETSLLYIATLFNNSVWRYSYGRKCFRQKLESFKLIFPVERRDGETWLDEPYIAKLFPKKYSAFVPAKSKGKAAASIPALKWKAFNLREIFDPVRGDFHSLAALSHGPCMTVSRTADDNGVVGYFEQPDEANVYSRGMITVSTVSADAFVQLDDFIATDNVIVCLPQRPLRITTLYFVAFALNHQKWRYSYGRQCYQNKIGKVTIHLPVKGKELDEDAMERIVTQTSYWRQIESRFNGAMAVAAYIPTSASPRLPGI